MAPGLLLHPPAHVVHGGVGQAHGVEVVDHDRRVGQVADRAVGVAPVRVQGHRLDTGEPTRLPSTEPGAHRLGRAPGHDVEQVAVLEVHEAGHEDRRVGRVGGQERRLVEPERRDGAHAVGVVDQGRTVVPDRRHDGVPAHAERPGQRGDGGGVLAHPTARFRPGPAGERRPGGDGRVGLGPGLGVAVRRGARHRRLAHTTTTGRPPAGRSRTTTRRRPLLLARAPQAGQRTATAVVSTNCHSSPSCSTAATSTKPANPKSAVAPWLPWRSTEGLLVLRP